jgi:hypothetical protein
VSTPDARGEFDDSENTPPPKDPVLTNPVEANDLLVRESIVQLRLRVAQIAARVADDLGQVLEGLRQIERQLPPVQP